MVTLRIANHSLIKQSVRYLVTALLENISVYSLNFTRAIHGHLILNCSSPCIFTIHICTLSVGHALPITTMNSTALHVLTNKHSTLLVNNIFNGHPCSLTSKMTQHSSTLNNAAMCNYHCDIE